jgi:phosphate transport system protein
VSAPGPKPLRTAFHQDLDAMDEKVVQLFALVTEGLAAATDTFLSVDREAAQAIVERDALIDSLYLDIQTIAERVLLLQAPMAGELRFVLGVLRIVPEIERSGDLAEHIAARAARGLGAELTPRIRGLIDRMGSIATEMWRQTADAYADRDGAAPERLNRLDDEIDDLHLQLVAELASGAVPLPVALEMSLVGRFYERLGDHAVHISERLRYVVDGV